MTKKAKLRICARCEWIYDKNDICPCGSSISYGARYVVGDVCYKAKYDQRFWLKRRRDAIELKLVDFIEKHGYKNKAGRSVTKWKAYYGYD